MMNKRSNLIFVVAAIAAIALGTWLFMGRGGAEEVTYRTADAERQDLQRTVSATGTVQPLTTVDIKSRAGGEVKVLAVEVGTRVKPGQLIARIDPTDSQTAFNQAEADVTGGQARIRQAKETLALQRSTVVTSIAGAAAGVRAAEARLTQAKKQAAVQPALSEAAVRQAQAGLRTAEQTLAQLRESGDPQARAEARTMLAAAEANLKNAEQDLQRQERLLDKGFVAQAAVDEAQTRRDVARAQADAARTRQRNIEANQKAEIASAQARVNEARASLAAAEAQRVQNSLRQQDVASARAALEQARASLRAARANTAQIGIRSADVETAQAQIARSQAQLRNAQVQLESTTIRAPRAGVVLQKYVEQGTIITSGQSFNSVGTSLVQLGDLSRIFVDAAVDEADIAQVKVGQPVKVVLDAFPDEEFEGRVRRIDPRGTTDQNVTTILTQIEIAKPDKRLKPGLNAECEFIVAEKKDALAIPARAVHNQKGKKVVEVLVGGKPVEREVKIGLEAGDTVEVVDGLQPGDKIVTQTIQPGDKDPRGGGPRAGQNGGDRSNRPGGFGSFGG